MWQYLRRREINGCSGNNGSRSTDQNGREEDGCKNCLVRGWG
uniref:Uncharacterized protein n=1 Tax=Siphoviridae sp. ctTrD1 TaxID=2825524 RepID=A0A8S5PR06_9CAUD|nr:MAG TPA: hypothetical protein [Siphoviridae sp. ctTrD1]